MTCLVPFCRLDCPVLPEGANIIRVSGFVICEVCNKRFDQHPKYAYPTGMRHIYLGCEGKYLHT